MRKTENSLQKQKFLFYNLSLKDIIIADAIQELAIAWFSDFDIVRENWSNFWHFIKISSDLKLCQINNYCFHHHEKFIGVNNMILHATINKKIKFESEAESPDG